MALPTKLRLEIVTPGRSLIREEVDEVVVPGSEGEFGILPGHTPLLSTLKVGELWYRQGQEKHYLPIAFGVAAGLPGSGTALADGGGRAQESGVQRAERAKQRAEQRLAQAPAPHLTPVDLDIERARIALLKALVRLNVATRARTRA